MRALLYRRCQREKKVLRREVDLLGWIFSSLCYQKVDNVSVCLSVSGAAELHVRFRPPADRLH